MVEMRSCRIRSSRAWRMEAHMLLKVRARRPISSSLLHRHFDVVVLPRHFGGRAVQLLHRLHDAARQQVGEHEAHRHRAQPEQDDVACTGSRCAAAAPSKERRMQISPTGLPAMSISGVSKRAYSTTPSLTFSAARPSWPGPRPPRAVARGFSVEAITPAGARNRNSLSVAVFEPLRHQRVHAVAGHQHVEQVLSARRTARRPA